MAMGPPNFADALLVGHRSTMEPKKLRLVAAAAAADDGYREALQAAVPCHWDLKTPASLQVAAAQVRFIAAAVTLEPSSCRSGPLPSHSGRSLNSAWLALLEAAPWLACSRPNEPCTATWLGCRA